METPNVATAGVHAVTSEGFNVDVHVKILDERVVQRAKARGLDAIVYAPHFTRLQDIRERAARYSDDELAVIPARELFTGTWQHRRHVLAIGLDEPVPDFITLDAAMAELDRQDAAVLIPHPTFLNVSFGREEVEQYRDGIDAVEVYNPKHLPHDNRRAREIARETGLQTFTSSYAHLHGTVGEAWISFDSPHRDAGSLADAFKSGAPRRLFHRHGVSHVARRALEFAHLGFENSWGKFDRLMLQGTEPTHPDHVAYEGRFDHCKVY
jgi:predicted metal-dependent phosphoesterase TrpH